MSVVDRYRLIFGTGITLVVIRLSLRLVSLPRRLRWLTCRPAEGAGRPAPLDKIVYYVDRWLTLFPYNPKGNCFPRTLALYWFARRRGLPVQFCCGVMKLHQRLEGHAWLMLNGGAFLEPSPYWQSFTVTVACPPTSSPSHEHPPVSA
ncbi:MAG: lasso peptide biosynthesis B2 protein [Nitrospira sp.]|nr:lasso peptide biosynthesis B2 protein [Nitrospira sp.]